MVVIVIPTVGGALRSSYKNCITHDFSENPFILWHSFCIGPFCCYVIYLLVKQLYDETLLKLVMNRNH